MKKINDHSAYTLIELTISLLIMGLITGIITVGIGLLEQAKLNNIIKEYNNYKSITYSFLEKYGQLPGDFNNATYFWYNSNSCPGHNAITGGCNGNNDKYINGDWQNGCYNSDCNESLRAWQHLNLAGYISNYLSGVAGINSYVNSTNIPYSNYGKGAWYFYNYYPFNQTITQKSSLILGSIAGDLPPINDSLITASELARIDNKIDDGLPISGIVISLTPNIDCYNGNPATYRISSTNSSCAIQFDLELNN